MDVESNRALWGVEYEWQDSGEEWSEAWGSSASQWFGTLLPRIGHFLPATTILEIAPGFGRWTQFLRESCEELIAVDVSEKCILACRERFAGDDRITYHVNDGSSLDMVEDGSVDFVFSFDSLVHAEADVLAEYLRQISRKLTPDGAGFIHHSNAGEYRRYFSVSSSLPARVRGRLIQARVLDHDGWRALSVTAPLFRDCCEASGLRCVSQELVNWGNSRRLTDCLSTFALGPATGPAGPTLVRNPLFMAEAEIVKRRAALYAPPGR
jgi:SAM-dependent methyltransferase